MRKVVALLLLLIFITSSVALLLPATVSAQTIVVPDDYATIQEAVENANNGDIISVNAGRYFGNTIVDKSVQIIGESPDSTTIYGDYITEEDRDTFQVNAPNVVIANLAIANEDTSGRCIRINADDCEVRNNKFLHEFGISGRAIEGEDCSNLSITENNLDGSIHLKNISGGTISENTFLYREGPLTIEDSSNIVFSGNDMTEAMIVAVVDGFVLFQHCTDCIAQNNIFGAGAITISGSSNCRYIDNTASGVDMIIIGSPNLQLKHSTFNSFKLNGQDLSEYICDIDTSNTVNGKPIYYLINQSDLEINSETYPNIGALYIINSTKIKINKLNSDSYDIRLVATTDSEITENNLADHSIMLELESNWNLVSKNNMEGGSNGGYISVYGSSNNNITRNTLHQRTIRLDFSAVGNRIVGNTIVDSYTGIFVYTATGNTIYHNNFIGYHNSVTSPYVAETDNSWTDGYPGGGNYWGYTGTDEKSGPGQSLTGPDAIIDSAKQGGDVYPLVAPVEFIDSAWQGTPITLEFITNSTISNLEINDATKTISFNATGEKDTTGFTRITIPNTIARDAWNSEYSITVNNQEVTFTTLTDNANTYSYVTFQNQAEPTPSFPPEEPTPSPSSSPSQEPTSSPPPEEPLPLSQIIIIALAAAIITALVAALVIFLRRKRKN
jgi:parallel beta-helix repeat protein